MTTICNDIFLSSIVIRSLKKGVKKEIKKICVVFVYDWLESLIHIQEKLYHLRASFRGCAKTCRRCECKFLLRKEKDDCTKRALMQIWSSGFTCKGERFVWKLLPQYISSKSDKNSKPIHRTRARFVRCLN